MRETSLISHTKNVHVFKISTIGLLLCFSGSMDCITVLWTRTLMTYNLLNDWIQENTTLDGTLGGTHWLLCGFQSSVFVFLDRHEHSFVSCRAPVTDERNDSTHLQLAEPVNFLSLYISGWGFIYRNRKNSSSCITTKSHVVMGDNLVEATSLGPIFCQHSNSYKLPFKTMCS